MLKTTNQLIIGAVTLILLFTSIATVSATLQRSGTLEQAMEEDQSSSTVVVWNDEPLTGHYFGMIESLDEQLFAYSESFIHVEVPEPEQGHYIIPMSYMDVFIGETRNDHARYLIKPYLVYYDTTDPFHWERHEVSPSSQFWPYIPPDATFPRTYVGTLGLGKPTSEDVVYPFRTGIASYHLEGDEWIPGDSVESDLGFWYLDCYPYNDGLVRSAPCRYHSESVLME